MVDRLPLMRAASGVVLHSWTARVRSGPPLVLTLGVGLLLRLLPFFVYLARPDGFVGGDSEEYLALGHDFVAAYLYSSGELAEVSFKRTPVYPLLVFVLHDAALVALVQIVLGVVTLILTHRIGRALGRDDVGRWAALWLALDGMTIALTVLVLSETLFTVLVVGSTLLWARAGSASTGAHLRRAGAGVLLGMAVLTRPIGLYLPAILLLAAWLADRQRGVSAHAIGAAMLLAGFLVPVGGWMTRNWALTGAPVLSTIVGESFTMYRAAGALVEQQNLPIERARVLVRARVQQALNDTSDADNPAVRSRVETRVGVQILRENLQGAAVSFVKGSMRTIVGPGATELARAFGVEGTSWPRAVIIGAGTFLLLATYGAASLGVAHLWRSRDPSLWTLSLPIVYFVLISAGAEAYSRFRFPAMPYLALLAGVGVARRNLNHSHGCGQCARYEQQLEPRRLARRIVDTLDEIAP